jgi:ssDNA thymidine ADP-ribosyltransferase, DarT
MRDLLNPEKALIFRITHRDNLPWILLNGLHCRNSACADSHFVTIGNPDLIDHRQYHRVKIAPGGYLSDYVPFYFTPFSMMALNIKTGFRGVKQRPNNEIAILVSSLHKLREDGVAFLFTDRHAYLEYAEYYSDLSELRNIDWTILQNRDFKRDSENPEKTDKYQAEALVHRHLPIGSLLGIVCYNTKERDNTRLLVERAGLNFSVISQSGWYF